jgi:hypothetical protein
VGAGVALVAVVVVVAALLTTAADREAAASPHDLLDAIRADLAEVDAFTYTGHLRLDDLATSPGSDDEDGVAGSGGWTVFSDIEVVVTGEVEVGLRAHVEVAATGFEDVDGFDGLATDVTFNEVVLDGEVAYTAVPGTPGGGWYRGEAGPGADEGIGVAGVAFDPRWVTDLLATATDPVVVEQVEADADGGTVLAVALHPAADSPYATRDGATQPKADLRLDVDGALIGFAVVGTATTFEGTATRITVEVDAVDWDADVTIAVPDSDEVVDLDEWDPWGEGDDVEEPADVPGDEEVDDAVDGAVEGEFTEILDVDVAAFDAFPLVEPAAIPEGWVRAEVRGQVMDWNDAVGLDWYAPTDLGPCELVTIRYEHAEDPDQELELGFSTTGCDASLPPWTDVLELPWGTGFWAGTHGGGVVVEGGGIGMRGSLDRGQLVAVMSSTVPFDPDTPPPATLVLPRAAEGPQPLPPISWAARTYTWASLYQPATLPQGWALETATLDVNSYGRCQRVVLQYVGSGTGEGLHLYQGPARCAPERPAGAVDVDLGWATGYRTAVPDRIVVVVGETAIEISATAGVDAAGLVTDVVPLELPA